jgi:hypothetical protein
MSRSTTAITGQLKIPNKEICLLSQIIRFTKEWSCIILPAHPGGSEVGCLGIATYDETRLWKRGRF